MAIIHVEKVGGLAGFGGAGGKLRSRGQVDTSTFSEVEQQAVESLFQSQGRAKPSPVRDGFRFRISRTTADGTETVEAPESAVPTPVAQCVKDELV
jgi:hypothetical protein